MAAKDDPAVFSPWRYMKSSMCQHPPIGIVLPAGNSSYISKSFRSRKGDRPKVGQPLQGRLILLDNSTGLFYCNRAHERLVQCHPALASAGESPAMTTNPLLAKRRLVPIICHPPLGGPLREGRGERAVRALHPVQQQCHRRTVTTSR